MHGGRGAWEGRAWGEPGWESVRGPGRESMGGPGGESMGREGPESRYNLQVTGSDLSSDDDSDNEIPQKQHKLDSEFVLDTLNRRGQASEQWRCCGPNFSASSLC